MVQVKYVLIVLLTFGVCAKIVGHTNRHFNPPAVEATVR